MIFTKSIWKPLGKPGVRCYLRTGRRCQATFSWARIVAHSIGYKRQMLSSLWFTNVRGLDGIVSLAAGSKGSSGGLGVRFSGSRLRCVSQAAFSTGSPWLLQPHHPHHVWSPQESRTLTVLRSLSGEHILTSSW